MGLGGSMKKIAILSLHLGYGGIEKCVVNLANILCDKYEVEIACTYKLYDKPAFDLDKRVKVNYLGCEAPNKKELKVMSKDNQKKLLILYLII